MSTIEVIEWSAPEYTYYPKTQNWYWGVATVAGVLVLVALFTVNLLLAIMIVIAAFAVMMYGARPPEVIKFALTRRGVRFHTRLYPYDQLKSFWIIEDHNRRKIILESDRLVLPHIVVPLVESVNAETVREYLRNRNLPEVRQEESLADILSDYFGF
ncbi:MAG: hypothetical protein AAB364_03195 [Patescibacteria group bacterium]